MENEEEQDRLDEILVTLIMDKSQIINPRIGAEYRTKEKVDMAWIEIQRVIQEDFPIVEHSIDDLKGRWTSIKGAFMGRKKKPKPSEDPKEMQEQKLDALMFGLFDVNTVKPTQSNISLPKSLEKNFTATESAETSVTDAIAPASFHKGGKSNDVNFQFLQTFNQLKDAYIQRDNDPKPRSKQISESLNEDGMKENDKVGRFLKYLAVLLADFNSSQLEDVQFEIIRVVRDFKKDFAN